VAQLVGVSALTPTNVWAAGELAFGTLAEHWDGSSWSVVPSPNVAGSTLDFFSAVSARSATNVWAVGASDVGASGSTLAEHWDGASWSIVPSQNVGAINEFLGVSALSGENVWAVGDESSGGGPAQSVIEHWNGKSWSVVPSPSAGATSSLAGVAGTSASDVWAVGLTAAALSPTQALIEHWNGLSWSVVPSPTLNGGSVRIRAVAALAPNNAWIAGTVFSVTNPTTTLIEHWDGTSWSVVPSPNPSTNSQFSGITASSATNAWAVGFSVTHPAGNPIGVAQTLIEHWDGTSWSTVPSQNPGAVTNDLYAVSAIRGSSYVWAAGDYGNSFSLGTIDGAQVQNYCK
jgi:hypothetical protein